MRRGFTNLNRTKCIQIAMIYGHQNIIDWIITIPDKFIVNDTIRYIIYLAVGGDILNEYVNMHGQ